MNSHDTCVIGWRDSRTGLTGQGKSTFSRDAAQRLCDSMDAEYPTISHFPVPVPGRPVIVVEGDEDEEA